MTKKDLKDGMVVELRNGDMGLILDTRIVCEDGWLSFGGYKENLIYTTKFEFGEFDIIKIYNTDNVLFMKDILNKKYLNLIWQRELELEYLTKEELIELIKKERGNK